MQGVAFQQEILHGKIEKRSGWVGGQALVMSIGSVMSPASLIEQSYVVPHTVKRLCTWNAL